MRYLPNKVKQALSQGKPVLGSWLNIPSLSVTEIMARSGFDFLVIDTEHSAISLQTAQEMVMVIEGYGQIPFIRVEDNNRTAIKKALEIGCYGIVVPMVNYREDVEKAMDSIIYCPEGKRGVGLSRAQEYGLGFDRYQKWYKDNISLVVQIEHIKAIDNLEEIVSSPEVDATIIGPYDLSASMGIPGEFTKKELRAALERYVEVSRKYKKPYGCHVVQCNRVEIKRMFEQGYTFLVYGIDELFLAQKSKDEYDAVYPAIKKSAASGKVKKK